MPRESKERSANLRAADHQLYQQFFADIDKETVAALRHREICPLCARMTRILLFGFLPPSGSGEAPQEGA